MGSAGSARLLRNRGGALMLLCVRARMSIKFFRIVQCAFWRMGSITDGKDFFVLVYI